MSKKRDSRRTKPQRADVQPLFSDDTDGVHDVEAIDDERHGAGAPQDPTAQAHRRVRAGELYYVADDASPEGWTVVEISGVEDDGPLAGFAVGQLEAIPLDELEDRILGPVAAPGNARRAA